jgi:hypothetical protein
MEGRAMLGGSLCVQSKDGAKRLYAINTIVAENSSIVARSGKRQHKCVVQE